MTYAGKIVVSSVLASLLLLTTASADPQTGLTISSPLALGANSVSAGQTLTANVTWTNTSASGVVAKEVTVTALPPGATAATGPWLTLQPGLTPGTVPAGGSVALTATRAFTGSDALGAWTAYASYQDSNGAWTSGPLVPFTVVAASAPALTISSLNLGAASVTQGQTLNASVTFKNTYTTGVVAKALTVTALPPGATGATGPWINLSPTLAPGTVAAGASVTLNASRAFTASDATGTWQAYASWQDSANAWHSGPIVTFAVTSAAAPGVLSLTSPLTLNSANITQGQTLSANVRWTNQGSTSVVAKQASVTVIPPSGTTATGPWISLTPIEAPGTIAPGGALALNASRAFSTSDATGTWTAYAAYQDGSGNWQCGPMTTFNVVSAPPSNMHVTAYYVGWHTQDLPPSDIDFTAITHLCHFAVTPNANGTVNTTANGNFSAAGCAAIVNPAHAAGCKVLITVGGWGEIDNFRAAIAPSVAPTFVANIVSFVVAHHYDGVDVDMEPLALTDAPNYQSFITQLRAALKARGVNLLLASVGLNAAPIVAPVQSDLDQINIMTYDMANLWIGASWYNSALYDGGTVLSNGSHPTSCDATVHTYLSAGVAPQKLGIGMEFYGYVWSGATGPLQNISNVTVNSGVAYSEIMSSYYSSAVARWDSGADVPWLALTGTNPVQFVSYDDATSCAKKVQYAKSNGLGGVIIWELWGGYEASKPAGQRDALLQAVKTAWRGP